jgi:hypothetical protein
MAMSFTLRVRKTWTPVYYGREEEIGPSVATQGSAGNKPKGSTQERRRCFCDNPNH